MANEKYKVISPLRHDGKPYEPGAYVSLDKPDAKSLIASGVIEKPKKKDSK